MRKLIVGHLCPLARVGFGGRGGPGWSGRARTGPLIDRKGRLYKNR